MASIATGGVSIIFHVEDEESEPVWALSRQRNKMMMVAVEEIADA